jgi:hypothetical protein
MIGKLSLPGLYIFGFIKNKEDIYNSVDKVLSLDIKVTKMVYMTLIIIQKGLGMVYGRPISSKENRNINEEYKQAWETIMLREENKPQIIDQYQNLKKSMKKKALDIYSSIMTKMA